MRVGSNPLRRQKVLPPYRRHRIIVPVYIPGVDGYFKEALEVFRMSLASLLATVDPNHTAITLIDNACVPEVEALVLPELRAGRIDRYIRHEVNRGKSDPVVGELRASYEPLLTIADSDVLFLHGWQREIENIFEAFPAAVAVSPSPAPNLLHYAVASTWLQAVTKWRIRLEKRVDEADLDQFEASVGKDIFDAACRRQQFILRGRRGHEALLGAGHFVISFRRECFTGFDYSPGLEGTGSGDRLIDEHVDASGGLRLATIQAWVKHMGNVPEDWMREKVARILAGQSVPGTEAALGWRPDLLTRVLAATPYRLRALLSRLVCFAALAWRRLQQRSR